MPTFCSSSRLSSWILLLRSFSSFSSRWLMPFFSSACGEQRPRPSAPVRHAATGDSRGRQQSAPDPRVHGRFLGSALPQCSPWGPACHPTAVLLSRAFWHCGLGTPQVGWGPPLTPRRLQGSEEGLVAD